MDLLQVEHQRQTLEENLQKLRRSLKHWQTLEAEYEGLKEEVQQEPASLDAVELIKIAKDYNGDLVDEWEVRDIAGLERGSPRSAEQIVRIIERRQEYVQRNIETLQRQFFDTEAKLEEFDFASRRESDAGLPLTEIHEELDEEGNVISSHLSHPEAQQSKLVDSLRKAGLTEENVGELSETRPPEPLRSAITNASPPITPKPTIVEKRAKSASDLPVTKGDAMYEDHSAERPPIRKKSVSFSADTKAAPEVVRLDIEDGKKSVSFAEKVAVAPAAPLPDTRSVSFSSKVEEIPPQPLGPALPKLAQKDMQRELRASFKPGDKVKELNDDDEVVAEHVVLSEDETLEDAKARREMLDYHLNEVGHVVAQMDLEEGEFDGDDDDDTSSHFTSSTYLDDEDTPYSSGLSDEDEDEDDEFGRTKHRMVSDDYRQEMLEMEKRLIGNLGPAPRDEDIQNADSELDPQDVRRLVIRDKRHSTSSASSYNSERNAGSKKRVSFAEALDVAEPGSPPLKAQKHEEGENVAPVSETISERTTAASHSLPSPNNPAKVSRFRKAHSVPKFDNTIAGSAPDTAFETSSADETPEGPPGKTVADVLVERSSVTSNTMPPSADNEDPIIERRQLAAEYYRCRNDTIKQQGGFMRNEDEDEALGELMEERDGKLKKVSRFKAARIKS